MKGHPPIYTYEVERTFFYFYKLTYKDYYRWYAIYNMQFACVGVDKTERFNHEKQSKQTINCKYVKLFSDVYL